MNQVWKTGPLLDAILPHLLKTNFFEGERVGRDPLVFALLKRLFNYITHQPRYSFIWDIKIVLYVIRLTSKTLDNHTIKI